MKKDILKALLTAVGTVILTAAVSVSASAGIEDTIKSGLNSGQTTIDVSRYKMSPQDAMDTYFTVVTSNPDIFYVENHVDCTYDMKSGHCLTLVCSYNTKDINGRKKQFNETVDKLVAKASEYDTSFDKIKAVHDYMVEYFEYDVSSTNLTAYDLVTNKKGTCTSYTGLFKAAMDKLGIENTVAVSNDMSHTWNVVKADGNWYHVDVTWDDPIGGNGITYVNFMKSDKMMGITGHIGWICENPVSCSDTQYDTFA